MANPTYQPITATGTGTAIVLDHLMNPMAVSYAFELGSGAAATAGVQYTMDDVNDPTWVPVWIADTSIPAGTTATTHGTIGFSIRAIRIVTTVFTTGPVRFAVIQGLSIN